MTNPTALVDTKAEDWYELIDTYPWFQTAHLLLQKTLHLKENPGYLSQLSHTAIHVGSREKLYYLIHQWDQPDEKDTIETPAHQSSDVNTADNNLTPTSYVLTDLKQANSNDNIEHFTQWLELIDQRKPVAHQEAGEEKQQFQRQDLIDRFIEQDPTITPLKQVPPPTSAKHEKKEKQQEKEPEFVTEVLARIYVKQHKYNKAINIYKKLSLKYPEKSVYFAGQLEIVEKLINKKDK